MLCRLKLGLGPTRQEKAVPSETKDSGDVDDDADNNDDGLGS